MRHIPALKGQRGALAIPGKRGIQYVRADAAPSLTEINQLIKDLAKNFEDFKTENNKALADVKKDVVQTEKVDRINATIEKQQKALDELSQKLAAMRITGAVSDPRAVQTAERIAHRAAFNTFFRKGAENGLRELEVKAALSSDSSPDGGYTVTYEMETLIDRVLATVSAMRGLATVRNIGTLVYKKLVTKTGAASGWVGERGSRTETNTPTLSELAFEAMEIYAEPAATQGLLDDSFVNIEEWLADEVAIEFAAQEGAAFITGNGVAKPRGITSYGTVADASWAWGSLGFIVTGAAADFAASNPADALIGLQGALKQGYQTNGTWISNRTVQTAIRKFKDGQGQYLWQPGMQAGAPPTLFGKPYVTDDNMPNVGAGAFPVAYGDFRRGYLIVDRVGIRVLRDPFTSKPYVLFYTTKRVGGGVQNFEAIKLLKCSA